MAHFAKIDNGKVVDLIVVADKDCAGGQFPKSEAAGQKFIETLAAGDPRLAGVWKQTSYNSSFRGVFGQVGYTYDPVADVFVESVI